MTRKSQYQLLLDEQSTFRYWTFYQIEVVVVNTQSLSTQSVSQARRCKSRSASFLLVNILRLFYFRHCMSMMRCCCVTVQAWSSHRLCPLKPTWSLMGYYRLTKWETTSQLCLWYPLHVGHCRLSSLTSKLLCALSYTATIFFLLLGHFVKYHITLTYVWFFGIPLLFCFPCR